MRKSGMTTCLVVAAVAWVIGGVIWANEPTETKPGLTVVICPEAWREELQPWMRLRVAQGHRLAMAAHQGSPDAIRARLIEISRKDPVTSILLIGDHDVTPMWRLRAEVNVAFGSEPELASDQPYADFDADGSPDAAVGRWSVDNREQLKTVINKVVAYETKASFGDWRRKVHVVAGVGGFGPLVDGALQMATRHFLTNQLPNDFLLTMTHGDWKSPYCPDPRRFRDAVVDRMNEGGLFWVYIGHGQRTYLDRVRTPVGGFPILDARDHASIACRDGHPIAMFLACYAGAIDFERESLAEELFRDAGGPVAVLAGSRVTMPYGMAVMAHHMMTECFEHQRGTLGQIVLHAKQHMLQPLTATTHDQNEGPQQDANRRMLDAIAQVMSPNREHLQDELREHTLLFNLVGDPLSTIRHPELIRIELDQSQDLQAGKPVIVRCETPLLGSLRAELACRRDRSTSPLRFRTAFDVAGLAAYDQDYRRANQHTWDHWEQIVAAPGVVELQLTPPKDARGPGHVRIFVEGSGAHASGAADVYVRQ